jgi:hypothetical protein
MTTTAPTKPKPPRYADLLKLAAFLEKLPRRKFDFDSVVRSWARGKKACGSVCCAMGWCPAVFPKRVSWDSSPDAISYLKLDGMPTEYDTAAELLFSIPYEDACALFTGAWALAWLNGVALNDSRAWGFERTWRDTPKNVAASIRAYVKWKKTGKPTDPATVLKGAIK